MSIEPITPHARVIDGLSISIMPLDAMSAWTLQPHIAPALGEVVGALGGITGDKDITVLGPAVARFFGVLPPAELEWITKKLLYAGSIDGNRFFLDDGKPHGFNQFRGRMSVLWKVIGFACEVNYPDFFTLALAAVAKAAKAANAPSSEGSLMSVPFGPSGDSSPSDGPPSPS